MNYSRIADDAGVTLVVAHAEVNGAKHHPRKVFCFLGTAFEIVARVRDASNLEEIKITESPLI